LVVSLPRVSTLMPRVPCRRRMLAEETQHRRAVVGPAQLGVNKPRPSYGSRCAATAAPRCAVQQRSQRTRASPARHDGYWRACHKRVFTGPNAWRLRRRFCDASSKERAARREPRSVNLRGLRSRFCQRAVRALEAFGTALPVGTAVKANDGCALLTAIGQAGP
jgi:hypothetical protein